MLVYACPAGKGGVEKLFPNPRKQAGVSNTMPQIIKEPPLVPKDVLTRTRMEQFLKFFPDSFVGNDPSDPWNPVIGFINEFNKIRRENVAASFHKVMDEIMSWFQPRASKTGGLPNISVILRKPAWIGSELKAGIDILTGKFRGFR